MRPIGIEVKTLTPGMDAGIGATTAMCFQGGVKDAGKSILEDILHGASIQLALPAFKVGAVIGTDAFPSHGMTLAIGEFVARLGCDHLLRFFIDRLVLLHMARKSSRKLWADYVARGGQSAGTSAKTEILAPQPYRGVVLGIDPSLRGSGFAALDYRSDRDIRVLESISLKLRPALTQIECLAAIGHQVEDLVDRHTIRHVAIEETIYVQNFQTAQILGAARGAAVATAAMRGLPVFEYAPLRIKQAVVGAGRASKEQVARTLAGLTGYDFQGHFDESDAAAVALCHAFTWRETNR
jgi:crossover junction endodeoxyribonuclease RuvC